MFLFFYSKKFEPLNIYDNKYKINMSKTKVACSIQQWLKTKSKKLWETIDDNCLSGLLNPRRNGVTFCFPDDKTYQDKLIKLLNADDPMDGVRLLQAHVLFDCIDSIDEFRKKQSDIPNGLKQRLQIDNITGDTVKLKNGAELVPMKDFKPRQDKVGRINVLCYKGNVEMPVDGERTAWTYRDDDRKSDKKVKGGWASRPDINPQHLAHILEGHSLGCITKGLEHYRKRNAYLEVMCSLLCWAKADKALYDEIIKYLDPYPEASFYVIVCHGCGLSQEKFTEWIQDTLAKAPMCGDLIKMYNDALALGDGSETNDLDSSSVPFDVTKACTEDEIRYHVAVTFADQSLDYWGLQELFMKLKIMGPDGFFKEAARHRADLRRDPALAHTIVAYMNTTCWNYKKNRSVVGNATMAQHNTATPDDVTSIICSPKLEASKHRAVYVDRTINIKPINYQLRTLADDKLRALVTELASHVNMEVTDKKPDLTRTSNPEAVEATD